MAAVIPVVAAIGFSALSAKKQRKEADAMRATQSAELAALQKRQDDLANESKAKEERAVDQAFQQVATKRRVSSGGPLAGASLAGDGVGSSNPIGGIGRAPSAAKKLIGQ